MPVKSKTPDVGYEYGDTVYAHAGSGPMVLKVLASGKDGFTGETDTGELVKVPHDKYLGHQRRVKHAYTVADEGEDGALLEDETGQRRFVAGGIPKPPKDKPPRDNANRFARVHTQDLKLDGMGSLSKAFALMPALPPLPDGPVLLLKASASGAVRPVKEQPSQRKAKAKATGKAKAKKTPDDEDDPNTMPPALHKHGDFIAFRHGDVIGCGRIVGSGQDGVSVMDEETGREHLVRHDAILDEHPPDPGPCDDPKMIDAPDKTAKMPEKSKGKKPA